MTEMKKNYFLVAAMLFGAALFTSCSDDDENGNGGNNGGRKVERIVGRDDNGARFVEFSFDYDGGRLARVDCEFEEDAVVSEISYEGNRVEVNNSDGSEQTFELEGGRVTRSSYDGYFAFEREYVYSGGYLSRIDEDGEELFELSVSDGNLIAVTEEGVGESVFTPGGVANNTQVDLYAFILSYVVGYLDDGEMDFYLGLTGERFRYLPSRIVDYETDSSLNYTVTTSFDYDVDENGYVTAFTVRYLEGYNDGETTDSYEERYTITYE